MGVSGTASESGGVGTTKKKKKGTRPNRRGSAAGSNKRRRRTSTKNLLECENGDDDVKYHLGFDSPGSGRLRFESPASSRRHLGTNHRASMIASIDPAFASPSAPRYGMVSGKRSSLLLPLNRRV